MFFNAHAHTHTRAILAMRVYYITACQLTECTLPVLCAVLNAQEGSGAR